MKMIEDDKFFIIKQNKKTILKVEKITRNTGYYAAKRENAEMLNDIFS